jgi:cell division protein FtsB
MDGNSVIGKRRIYKSPRHAQVWFLERSRKTWKDKYVLSKQNEKRLENGVRDVTKSRQKWADQARALQARLKQLAAENEALKQELEVLKKDPRIVL